jgi:hypothetical protein
MVVIHLAFFFRHLHEPPGEGDLGLEHHSIRTVRGAANQPLQPMLPSLTLSQGIPHSHNQASVLDHPHRSVQAA